MYLENTRSNVRPSAVIVETLGDGRKIVRMADGIQEETGEGGTQYVYDEVVFELDADRKETAEDIEESFADWWVYGQEPEEAPPTIEERLSLVEDMLMEVIGGIEE